MMVMHKRQSFPFSIVEPEKIIGLSKDITIFFKINGDGWTSEYSSINKLLIYLYRKSQSASTRNNYLQIIKKFCLSINMTSEEVVKRPKKEVEKFVQQFADSYNKPDYSRRTANHVIATLKSFFKINGFTKTKELDIYEYYIPTRYRKRNEYIPKKHEIYSMADVSGSPRNRALILTLFSSGLRNSTLIALRYKDIKDELLQGITNIKIPVYPEMKKVIPNACKNSLLYYTFICDEAFDALQLYLYERTEKYGKISDGDPLFASDYNQITKNDRSKKFLTSRQVEKIVKLSAKTAGIEKWRDMTPHCLRKSFETVLHSITIDGNRLDPKIQEFLMGHLLPGSQDNYFDISAQEDIRFEYSKLKFNRVVVENKFKRLRNAIAEAFEGTGEDIDKLINENVNKKNYMQNNRKKV